MLGYVHDSTTLWRFWDPHWRQVIQASNVTFLESDVLKLNSSGGIGLDGLAARVGLGASSELDYWGGLGLNASAVGLVLDASSELNSSYGLGLDALAIKLGLGVWS